MANDCHILLMELDPSDPRFLGAAREWADEAKRDFARLIATTRETIATSRALLAAPQPKKPTPETVARQAMIQPHAVHAIRAALDAAGKLPLQN